MSDLDLEDVHRWRNHPTVRQVMYTQHEISWKEHVEWWSAQQGRDDKRNLIFTIDGEARGAVSFSSIDKQHGRADWAFFAAPEALKGTGRRMESCALAYAFGPLKLRKLGCEVLLTNRRVVNLHKSFGFKVEGIFRKHVVLSGGPADVVRLAMFGSHWHTRNAQTSEGDASF
jgi:UDP-4-amino-4,6-dideoxy-N-acetyl-beta-L-altrosamine N-acetyltransferase